MSRTVGPRRWFFDAWSNVYDLGWVQRMIYRPEQDVVLDLLREEPPHDVLDIGCGTGQLGHRIRTGLHGVRVVGCDFSAGMLHEARRRDGGVRWVQGDATRLPFATAAFDAVVSTQAFHWFPDQPAALAEITRVLRPGGRLLVSVVMPPIALIGLVVEAGSRLIGEPFHWPGARELCAAAGRVGLAVERQMRIFRLPGAFVFPPVLTVARRARDGDDGRRP